MYVKFIHSELQALGIEYLSAALKERGHRTQLVIDPYFSNFKNVVRFWKVLTKYKQTLMKKILSDNPDLLAFSVTSYNMEWACNWTTEIKKHSSTPIVFGGIQTTLMPENIFEKSKVDFIILGEGEQPLCELADSLKSGKLDWGMRNLCLRRDGNFLKNPLRDPVLNLDNLPFPDKNILPQWFNRNAYRIITGRGCPGDCSYCCAPIQRKMYANKRQFIRRRSVNNVIDELKKAKKIYKIKRILFEDDLFTYDKEWLREFSACYKKEVSIPCLIHATPKTIDEEIIALLKRMACYCVEIGVQSLKQKVRNDILFRYDSNEQIKNAIMLLKENKINCICDNIISVPGSAKSDIINMVKFYSLLRPGKLEVLRLEFYPQAPIIYKTAHPEDVLREINEHGFAISWNKDSVVSAKIILLLGLSYIFPPKIISFILRKKIYRFFPYVNDFNHFNEIIFYISSIFKKERRKAFISFRADLFLKLKYLFSN